MCEYKLGDKFERERESVQNVLGQSWKNNFGFVPGFFKRCRSGSH